MTQFSTHTMFKMVCPLCMGDVVNMKKRRGMYFCPHCQQQFEAKELKTIPVSRTPKETKTEQEEENNS